MKLLKFIPILLIITLACTKKDVTPVIDINKLYGTWNYESTVNGTGKASSIFPTGKLFDNLNITEFQSLTFKADSTGTADYAKPDGTNASSQKFTYTLSGNTLKYTISGITLKVDLAINSNKLTVSAPKDDQLYLAILNGLLGTSIGDQSFIFAKNNKYCNIAKKKSKK